MRKILTVLSLAAVSFNGALAQEGPTMGWSSWNTYGVNISEDLIRTQASAMVSKGLKKVGYDHINIDDGYFGGRDAETGQLLIHPTRFPNGLKDLVDFIHGKGLKAGIYSDAGRNTCGSYHNGDRIAIGVGLYEHDQQDADFFFKELGFDFIKVDFCGGDPIHNEDQLRLDERERYIAIAEAIKNTGRTDVRMNACRWAYPGTWIDGTAYSWRTTGDIYDGWESVKSIIAENLYLSAYSGKGHFNDMDMLEVGRSMTTEEDKTHFGMWCILNSPLLIGCNLSNIKTATLNLLKNKELIALNQDTLYQQAYVATKTDGCYVMVRDIETRYGNKRAFAVYNPNDEEKTITVKFNDIDLGGTVKLRDVFQKKDVTGEQTEEYEVTVPKHGTRIYVAEAETRLERTRYEAETAYIDTYQEITWAETGRYEEDAACAGGYKATWLGNGANNDLVWPEVYSQEGGKYKLTIAYLTGESRSFTVGVNGKKVRTITATPKGWGTVGTVTANIQLEKGVNQIRLYNTSGWMPNIDYIELQNTTPSAISNVVDDSQDDGDAFNIVGQKVDSKNTHGIVIRRGKKYLKK